MSQHRSAQSTFTIAALVGTALLLVLLIWLFDWNFYPMWMVTLTAVTFLLYRYDKGRAGVEGATRVPEVVLLGLTWAGGVIGAAGGMYMQPRHKTQKSRFVFTLIGAAILHVAFLIWWLMR